MTSRDAILQRIRSGLGAGQSPAAPPVPDVWPHVTSDPAELAKRFADELSAVHGETIRAATMDEARRRLAELLDAEGWTPLGAVDRPLAREMTAELAPERVAWAQADWQPARLADLPAGLVSAEWLLADTGTCVIACATVQERLMCYLPPACIVVARVNQLAEHLPAAWGDLSRRCAQQELTGEFLMVTGPSRTADIEKILILGVHGPKRLIVLLVG
ncbi:MAG: lactate utilization protein [Thermoguttaceae bacterium]|jgi:L-lactate utilization protein LutC